MGRKKNKKLIQKAFDRWARGKQQAFFDLLDDDVRWTVIGSTAISRTYPTKRDFLETAVAQLTPKLEGGIAPSVKSILADGDMVAVQWEGRARARAGFPYHQTYSWVMRMRKGKVVEGTAYLDTELVQDVLKSQVPA